MRKRKVYLLDYRHMDGIPRGFEGEGDSAPQAFRVEAEIVRVVAEGVWAGLDCRTGDEHHLYVGCI